VNKRTLAIVVWLLLAAGCFIMGGLSLAGVVSRADLNGRFIFGIGWFLIGAGWIGRYYLAKKNWRRESDESRGS
jgi:hypothetical protein